MVLQSSEIKLEDSQVWTDAKQNPQKCKIFSRLYISA